VDNNVFVATSVNGSPPLSFGLDTGTSSLVFDTAVAKQLGIPCVCRFRRVLGGGNDLTLVCVTPSETVSVGSLQATSEGLIVDLAGLSHDKVGQPVPGILGGSVLSNLIVGIDYPARELVLGNPRPTEPGDASVTVAMPVSGGVPYVHVKLTLPNPVKKVEALLLVDTGTQETLILNQPFVVKHKLLQRVSPLISTLDFGLGGEIPYALGRLASVQLGPLEIVNPVVNFAVRGTGSLGNSGFDGFLGAEVLKRCIDVFDYPHRKLRLTPGPAFDAPYEYGMSGMVLVAKGPSFDIFTVVFVIADSPAAEADIRIGDVITSIDGRPASDLTLSEIEDLFLALGRWYRLGVARGTLERKVKIQMRRLI
jgi:hypothetical protein